MTLSTVPLNINSFLSFASFNKFSFSFRKQLSFSLLQQTISSPAAHTRMRYFLNPRQLNSVLLVCMVETKDNPNKFACLYPLKQPPLTLLNYYCYFQNRSANKQKLYYFNGVWFLNMFPQLWHRTNESVNIASGNNI